MKLWEKKDQLNKQIESFTVGNDHIIDQKLVKYDCLGSIAHAEMLKKIGFLTDDECDKIVMTLHEIIKLDGNSSFIIEQQDEDCHTAIENYLVRKIGNIGKKLHTARSRNDQVLTALRLYYKNEIEIIIQLIDSFVESLELFKVKNENIQIPGYTHMKKAMPSSFGMWSECFIESMKENKELLLFVSKIVDKSPLGTGSGYGLPIEVDRNFTAKLLGFKEVQNNPIYVQNSRGKFESSILHSMNQIMFDLNKISSDLLLFNMDEFGFIKIPDDLCTGSSIMPHKKNPDALEIVRGNYHKILSYEFQIKTTIANLISGYNRDLQLTKKPMMDGFEVVKNSLNIMKLIIDEITINKKNCKKTSTEELYATEEVYNLVKKGMFFRDAYFKISKKYD